MKLFYGLVRTFRTHSTCHVRLVSMHFCTYFIRIKYALVPSMYFTINTEIHFINFLLNFSQTEIATLILEFITTTTQTGERNYSERGCD